MNYDNDYRKAGKYVAIYNHHVEGAKEYDTSVFEFELTQEDVDIRLTASRKFWETLPSTIKSVVLKSLYPANLFDDVK